mmetsp:Transcript_33138/g.100119  ORF Transcript_33138/g.100119 Transcript_33138/m.100119 type:complete len:388 (-) Transcript_33138:133-1296(-)
MCHGSASVEIRPPEPTESFVRAANPEVVPTRRNAEPSHARQALYGLHRVGACGGAAVLRIALAVLVRPHMGVRPFRHDPTGSQDPIYHRLIAIFDGDQSVDVKLSHVLHLVFLSGMRPPIFFQATDLVPHQSPDVETTPVVFLLESVIAQHITKIVAPTTVGGIGPVGRAIRPVAMKGQIRHVAFAIRRGFTSLEEVVQPTNVVRHRGAQKFGVTPGARGAHVIGPRLRIRPRVRAQVVIPPGLASVVRLVPTLDEATSTIGVGARHAAHTQAQGAPRLLDHGQKADPGNVNVGRHPPVVMPHLPRTHHERRGLEVLAVVLVPGLVVRGDAAKTVEHGPHVRLDLQSVLELHQGRRLLQDAAGRALCGRLEFAASCDWRARHQARCT